MAAQARSGRRKPKASPPSSKPSPVKGKKRPDGGKRKLANAKLNQEGQNLLAMYMGQSADPVERERTRIELVAKAIVKSRVLQSREDPNAFVEYCFCDSETGKPFVQADIHRDFQASMSSGKDSINLFARDHGKTSQLEAHAIWRLGNNPDLRIKIVCASDGKAVERLFAIIQHIRVNDRIHDVFPWLTPAKLGDWCVPLDSTLHMGDGILRLAADVKVGDVLWGWAAKKQGVCCSEVEHVSATVLKPCVRVVTETGREFRSSTDHKMLSGNGYIRAGNLAIGSPVALGRGMGPYGIVDVSRDEARLLGYLVGDGYTATKAGGPWFTNGEESVLDDFIRCVHGFGWGTSEYADRGTYRMLGVTRGTSDKNPRHWLTEHNLLGKKSGNKRIPVRLFRSGWGALVDFLRAYFACDGCFDESVTRASWTTMSHGLAKDLLLALRLLGVPSRMTPDRTTGAWMIGCAGWSAVDLVEAWGDGESLSNKEVRFRDAVQEYKATHDRVLRQSDLVYAKNKWRRRLDSDSVMLGWERVVNVDSLGILPCVDFTVAAPTDTFLLDDGFIAHNSKHKIVVEREHITRDASIEALGVLSTATGGRADLLFADDVVDRRNALELPKLRETVKSAWDSDWSNILEPNAQSIYVATPWHTADLTHKLLKNPAYQVLKREVGTASDPYAPVWEEKWPREALEKRRLKIGQLEYDRGFRLRALSGDFATVREEWIEYWETPPDLGSLVIFQAFDVSSGAASDYFAPVTVGVDPKTLTIYVLEAWHAKLTFLGRAQAIGQQAARWQPAMQGLEQENMKSLSQYLDATTLLNILPLHPHLAKAIRLMNITPLMELGRVLFNPSLRPENIRNREEHGDLVSELLEFPLGANDDLVDAFVYAVSLAQTYGLADADDGVEMGVSVIGADKSAAGSGLLDVPGDGAGNGTGTV